MGGGIGQVCYDINTTDQAVQNKCMYHDIICYLK